MKHAELWCEVGVVFVCAALCLIFEPPAWVGALGTAAAFMLLRAAFRYREKKALDDLIMRTDRMLRSPDTAFLSDYDEGGLSVLSNAIRKLSCTLREQNEALRSDHIALKEALENLSHQLRTPLTSMTLLLDLLRSPRLTPEQRRAYTQELSNLLARMQWLIELLLKLSAIDAEAVQFAKEPVDCGTLIRTALDTVGISAELKAITVETALEGTPGYIGDFQRSCEALINLLKNCIEHTPEGGSIRIAASQSPVMTEITVTDSGPGISDEDLPHIFERFYRSADAAPGSGYGIGLAYAQRVFAMQQGALEASNVQPHGACFRIRIYPSSV